MSNIDEPGFSIRRMISEIHKDLVKSCSQEITKEVQFRATVNHVTITPMKSASEQNLPHSIVLPGVGHQYRKRSDGSIETPTDVLSQSNYTFMRPITGAGLSNFFSLARHFVEKTQFARRGSKLVLMVLAGYAAHVTFKTLKYFNGNDILVAGLPALASCILQPLDVGVFGPPREEFKKLLSHRTIYSSSSSTNDIYTVCELLLRS